MTDGGNVPTRQTTKHEEDKPLIFNLWPKILAIILIALMLLIVCMISSFKKCTDTTEEEIQVMVLDKSIYSYGEAVYCSCDEYYYFNPNTADKQMSVLIEYNGEQYMIHNILLHSKAKIGEYFDAVLVTDHYSDGSVKQRIKFDLGAHDDENE